MRRGTGGDGGGIHLLGEKYDTEQMRTSHHEPLMLILFTGKLYNEPGGLRYDGLILW